MWKKSKGKELVLESQFMQEATDLKWNHRHRTEKTPWGMILILFLRMWTGIREVEKKNWVANLRNFLRREKETLEKEIERKD